MLIYRHAQNAKCDFPEIHVHATYQISLQAGDDCPLLDDMMSPLLPAGRELAVVAGSLGGDYSQFVPMCT